MQGFDWDHGKRAKCQKHGVTIAQIEALFRGDLRIAPDPKHSHYEDRMIAVGRTGIGRPLFVAFTIRNQDDRLLVRPVSARYMHAEEVAAYEKESAKAQDR